MKKNINTYYIILFVVFPLFFSCGKEKRCDCLKSTGSITSEDRTIMNFNKISLEDNINLYITEDTFFSVRVEAGSHLLKSIKTEVEDSCLYLRNENKCNWVRSYKDKVNVYVCCNGIKGLIYNKASGNVYSTDTLHCGYFQLDDYNGSGSIDLTFDAGTTWFNLHTGPADLIVKGKSGVNYLYSAGNGKADLRDLKTNLTFITNNSTNNCWINVALDFEARIGYIGDIYYTGKPAKITSDITGSGKLISF